MLVMCFVLVRVLLVSHVRAWIVVVSFGPWPFGSSVMLVIEKVYTAYSVFAW